MRLIDIVLLLWATGMTERETTDYIESEGVLGTPLPDGITMFDAVTELYQGINTVYNKQPKIDLSRVMQ